MDFDDLDDAEAAAGPTPEQRAEELLASAMPPLKSYPAAKGKGFGAAGKMKMLYLIGGGVNEKIGIMQITNMFKEIPDSKSAYEWTVWPGTHKVPPAWNHDHSLKMYGPDFYLYYERWPFANCQWESWDGIDKSISEFKTMVKEKGPFDGVVGFDMGGELLLHLSGLAQEGDPDLQGQWRFMILFTASAPKRLSAMGTLRLKSPLCLPTVVSWSDKDEAHSYVNFEELALFIHPDFREVIRHGDGHRPPKLSKDLSETQRMVQFLQAMRTGEKFTPSDHADNLRYRSMWLPMVTTLPSAIPSTARRRLLLVQDPLDAHDLESRAATWQALKAKGEVEEFEGKAFVYAGTPLRVHERMKQAAAVRKLTAADVKANAFEGLEVSAVSYTAEHKAVEWHCKAEEVPSRQLQKEEVIGPDHLDLKARRVADEVMASIAFAAEDAVGILGIGTGAFIALAIAKLLVRERKQVPAGLWVVEAPTSLPVETSLRPGSLVDCPVSAFVHTHATCGPAWRYEVTTCGPFTYATYEDCNDLLKKVMTSFQNL
mmetsp:Transcript_57704/g.137285  ORF Transcript_57704/g.137285 Transcript_57704/m.137285 type:complete len:542 (-) Transcript_57704:148-1773(-)